MNKAAERRARKAAVVRARRQIPDLRAREAEALREAARRRCQDSAVREREAKVCRLAARRRRQDPQRSRTGGPSVTARARGPRRTRSGTAAA